MSPKNAIIIVFIMFFVASAVFGFLYINNRPVINQPIKPAVSNGVDDDSASQVKLSPVEQKIKDIETNTNQQVEQIVEQGATATGGVTVDAQKQIDNVVNQEIIEKMKLRTPEELMADEQRQAEQAERDRLINEQIKSQLQNK